MRKSINLLLTIIPITSILIFNQVDVGNYMFYLNLNLKIPFKMRNMNIYLF